MIRIGKQIYISQELDKMLHEAYGEGKISAGIERVMRAHLSSKDSEANLQIAEIKKACKRFNSEFPEWNLTLTYGVK